MPWHQWPGRHTTEAPSARRPRQAKAPAEMSVGDWFPDQLGDIDDQIRSGLGWVTGRADLAIADADDIVQPPVGLAVGQVKQCPDDLTASRWVSAAITVPLHHDRGAIVGLDDGAEVGPEGAFCALLT